MPEKINKTIVFIDLSGSTTLFEAIGDEAATVFVHSVTKDIATHLINSNGRVLKFLGDGVMAIFDEPTDAVKACLPLQKILNNLAVPGIPRNVHTNNISLRVGIDCGYLIEMENDAYGDIVNVAARVMSLAKPGEMLLTAETYDAQPKSVQLRCRRLGRVILRGRATPQLIYGLEMVENDASEHAHFLETSNTIVAPNSDWMSSIQGMGIKLSYEGFEQIFSSEDMPITVGRSSNCDLVINDSRVSRSHVQIDFIDDQFYVMDISINGTMIEYGDSSMSENAYPVTIRRQRTVLVRQGRIILGVWSPGYSDLTDMPPFVDFQILDEENVDLGMQEIRLPGV